jgi:hypothetical protein
MIVLSAVPLLLAFLDIFSSGMDVGLTDGRSFTFHNIFKQHVCCYFWSFLVLKE